MTRFSTILKVIEDDLTQSHQHLTLTSLITGSLDQFRKLTRKRPKEMAHIYNQNGRKVIEVEGDEHHCEFDYEELNHIYNETGQPLHIEHNHPNEEQTKFPTTLSYGDIQAVMTATARLSDDKLMLKSITCEDSWNNSRMTLVLGDKWFKEQSYSREMMEKRREVIGLGEELSNLWIDKYTKFKSIKYNYIYSELNSKTYRSAEEYEAYKLKVNKQAEGYAMKECGFYDELRKIKKKFRELDCRLELKDMGDSVIGEPEHIDGIIGRMS